jgi:hypothetical protein
MASTNFDLTNALYLITMPKPQGWKMMPPKKTMQRNTHLLLLDLRFTRRTSLALQSLNPSLESCAEGTCLADKIFQQLSIARCRSIVRVVK